MTTTILDLPHLKSEFESAMNAVVAARYGDASRLSAAVRYVLAGNGKRVRPLLCLLACRAFGGKDALAMPAAVALEMIHCYSLVHDDLPCMDDDDLRRGRPTAHRAFDEAEALLAGDALLTDAFALLGDDAGAFGLAAALPPATRLHLVRELAEASGGRGMVLGQSLDLYWTARPGATAEQLDEIHLRKTGYLLGAAAAMGAWAAEAGTENAAALRRFGQQLGLAFQIQDDLLDQSPATGKSPGKDQAAGKLTYLSHLGREEARRAAEQATAAAERALRETGADTAALVQFAQMLLQRTH